jgi:hypothetical protein
LAPSKEDLICDYFTGQGYKYIKKSFWFLITGVIFKRRNHAYGLERQKPDFDIDLVCQKIRDLLDGPDCIGRYWQVWHTFQRQGITVRPRISLKSIDGNGVKNYRRT